MRFGREIIGQRQFLGFLILLSRCMVTDGVRLLICTNCPICAYMAERTKSGLRQKSVLGDV